MMGEWNNWCWLLTGVLVFVSFFAGYALLRWKVCVTLLGKDEQALFDIQLRLIMKLLDIVNTLKYCVQPKYHYDKQQANLKYQSVLNDLAILDAVGIKVPVQNNKKHRPLFDKEEMNE